VFKTNQACSVFTLSARSQVALISNSDKIYRGTLAIVSLDISDRSIYRRAVINAEIDESRGAFYLAEGSSRRPSVLSARGLLSCSSNRAKRRERTAIATLLSRDAKLDLDRYIEYRVRDADATARHSKTDRTAEAHRRGNELN